MHLREPKVVPEILLQGGQRKLMPLDGFDLTTKLTHIEQAITTYLRDVCELGREVKTVEWHQLSLTALQQYLWDHFRLTEVHQLSRIALERWLADLWTTPSARTAETFSVNTMAAYARSARAFCNWLVQQEYLPETPFPKESMPKAERCLPHPIDQETVVAQVRRIW